MPPAAVSLWKPASAMNMTRGSLSPRRFQRVQQYKVGEQLNSVSTPSGFAARLQDSYPGLELGVEVYDFTSKPARQQKN